MTMQSIYSHHRAPGRRSLASDCGGAIMVIGLVMGVLLVGALWNIVSVGDAILWRERMQDAADAAAFETAVWNARGMNVIVFLNIVMSAGMAILVAVRGTVIFLTALTAALRAAELGCLVPTPLTAFLCTVGLTAAQPVDEARQSVTEFEKEIQDPIQQFLSGVQTAEIAIATATPVIGVMQTALRTTSEYDIPAFGISPSLLPTSTGSGPLLLGDARSSIPRIGRGVSLPVSADSDSKLCEKGTDFIPNELFAQLRRAHVPDFLLDGVGGFFRNLAKTVAATVPSVFCGGPPTDIAQLTDMFKDVARDNCAGALKSGPPGVSSSAGSAKGGNSGNPKPSLTADQAKSLEQYREYWKPGFIAGPDGAFAPGQVFNTARCEREELKRLQDSGKEPPGMQKPKRARPAKVWPYAQNGDFFMQAWGLSYHRAGRVSANDSSIDLPAPGSATALPANAEELGKAQAEIYWDTEGATGTCDGSWDKCSGEAMWLMRWKARLRRLHPPGEMAMRSLSQAAASELANAAHKLIGKALGVAEKQLSARAKNETLQKVTRFLEGKTWDILYKPITRQRGIDPIRDGSKATVADKLRQDPPPPDQLVIH